MQNNLNCTLPDGKSLEVDLRSKSGPFTDSDISSHLSSVTCTPFATKRECEVPWGLLTENEISSESLLNQFIIIFLCLEDKDRMKSCFSY